MDLTGIISISGKPGLYKVVAQAKNSVIVESLEDNKRVPAYATDRISALEDICIYTYGEDKPLKEIYADIYKKENGGAAISHKDDATKLQAYLEEVLPDYDKERVYVSDIKKLFQWYNLLHKSGNLKVEETAAAEEVAVEEKAEKAEKKPAAKKATAAKKTAAPKAAAAPKKTAAKTSGAAKAKPTTQRKAGS